MYKQKLAQFVYMEAKFHLKCVVNYIVIVDNDIYI